MDSDTSHNLHMGKHVFINVDSCMHGITYSITADILEYGVLQEFMNIADRNGHKQPHSDVMDTTQ